MTLELKQPFHELSAFVTAGRSVTLFHRVRASSLLTELWTTASNLPTGRRGLILVKPNDL